MSLLLFRGATQTMTGGRCKWKPKKWNIYPLSGLVITGHCVKCGPSRFISTERFRVNANGSRLDIWLIYQCERCGSKWNLRIYSRDHIGVIGQALYQRFMQNDAELALRCALDKTILRQNDAAADADSLRIQINGEIPFAYPCTIIMQPTMPLDVTVARVLAQKLGVSVGVLKRMEQQESLILGRGLKKTKLHHTATVVLYERPRA